MGEQPEPSLSGRVTLVHVDVESAKNHLSAFATSHAVHSIQDIGTPLNSFVTGDKLFRNVGNFSCARRQHAGRVEVFPRNALSIWIAWRP
jgi:hypothetical protein